MKNIAVILSAGSGTRFSADMPKQYHELEGKPVIYYTINSFVKTGIFDGIVLVMQPEYFDFGYELIDTYFANESKTCQFHICKGGSHRQESLYFGVLEAIRIFSGDNVKPSEIAIFSHCAARPIVPENIIIRNRDCVQSGYSVNTVKNIYDTVIYEYENLNCSFIDRSKTFLTLTPQTFISEDYITAYDSLSSKGQDMTKYTCACSLMHDAGFPIKLIKTDESIHKLTTKGDIETVRQLIINSKH